MAKFLSRIGIGAAEVDTILHSDTVSPGDTIQAHIEVEGGSTDQEIDEIDLAIMTKYEIETDEGESHSNDVIAEYELTDGFTVHEGEELRFDDIDIHIPETTPPTLGKTKVWVYTGLDIDWSVDPKDQDYLEVLPGPYLSALLESVEDLGFRRWSVKNESASRFGPHNFVQEFEYRPGNSRYKHDLDEIELLPVRQDNGLDVIVEVDRRGESLFGGDESHHRLSIDTTDTEQIKHQVTRLIDEQL